MNPLSGAIIMAFTDQVSALDAAKPSRRIWNADIRAPGVPAFTAGGDLIVSSGDANVVLFLDGNTGIIRRSFGGEGSGPGQFSMPAGVFIARVGTLLVADQGNHRIQEVDIPSGNCVKVLGAGTLYAPVCVVETMDNEV